MTEARNAALEYAHQNRDHFLDELVAFAAIPSVSTDPERKADMQRAAEWVAGQLRTLGMENVEVFPTTGHPVVFGQSVKAGAGAQTVLVYGHYDVQPAEPLELWDSPAFEPTLRGESLYARGASDMKGQVLAGLKAIEAIVRTGELPANLKVIVEGEEEIGSPSLGPFLAGHKDLLACDYALNLDSSLIGKDVPTISYGLRGLAYFELRVYGPHGDLHSGIYGGVVHNPAQALCELIAGMHEASGRITLPGFYDRVRTLGAEEREELARLPLDEAFYREQTGAPALWGDASYTPTERIGARPTLEVNGLLSGFTGTGSKTVLPAKAMAKLSMRLVPDQDPEEAHQQLLRYLQENAPATIHWELEKMAGGPPSLTSRDLPGVQSMSEAMQAVWGKRPVFKREGGSIPVVAQMQELLGIESVIAGFGLPDDNLHAPNEKIHIPTWYRGIDTIIHFIFNLKN